MLSIEGRIRDLALPDVFQLLARGRKSGVLHGEAPLLSRAGWVAFVEGAVVEAEVAGLAGTSRAGDPEAPRAIEEAALEMLCWRDGSFRFVPGPVPRARTRLAIEPLLIEAAQRAIMWERIAPLVPHARIVPAFRELEPGELPELRLSPRQWDVLAQVDGVRDLVGLATRMQRELTDVASLVHDLIEAGLLTVREAPLAPRRNPTPPVNAVLPPLPVYALPSWPHAAWPHAAAPDAAEAGDLWIPDRLSDAAIRMPGERDRALDAVFDPVAVGVLTAEGMPTPDLPFEALADAVRARTEVARVTGEPSFPGEPVAVVSDDVTVSTDGPTLCRAGDERLRSGDLMGAVACWDAALRAAIPVHEAERLREVIGLATRLHALVPP